MPTKATTTPAPAVIGTCVICGDAIPREKYRRRTRPVCDRVACERLHESQIKAASYRRTHTPKPELKPMLLGGHADEPEHAA